MCFAIEITAEQNGGAHVCRNEKLLLFRNEGLLHFVFVGLLRVVSGYASLTYLKKFPLDRLKIDKSFVSKLRADSDDMAIVAATISLGKRLGLSVIAEGIEDRATADLLGSAGCDEGQGYYFGRPMPATEFEQRFLSKDAPLTSGISAAVPAATAA